LPESYILSPNKKLFSQEENSFLKNNLKGPWILKENGVIELISDI